MIPVAVPEVAVCYYQSRKLLTVTYSHLQVTFVTGSKPGSNCEYGQAGDSAVLRPGTFSPIKLSKQNALQPGSAVTHPWDIEKRGSWCPVVQRNASAGVVVGPNVYVQGGEESYGRLQGALCATAWLQQGS